MIHDNYLLLSHAKCAIASRIHTEKVFFRAFQIQKSGSGMRRNREKRLFFRFNMVKMFYWADPLSARLEVSLNHWLMIWS